MNPYREKAKKEENIEYLILDERHLNSFSFLWEPNISPTWSVVCFNTKQINIDNVKAFGVNFFDKSKEYDVVKVNSLSGLVFVKLPFWERGISLSYSYKVEVNNGK